MWHWVRAANALSSPPFLLPSSSAGLFGEDADEEDDWMTGSTSSKSPAQPTKKSHPPAPSSGGGLFGGLGDDDDDEEDAATFFGEPAKKASSTKKKVLKWFHLYQEIHVWRDIFSPVEVHLNQNQVVLWRQEISLAYKKTKLIIDNTQQVAIGVQTGGWIF